MKYYKKFHVENLDMISKKILSFLEENNLIYNDEIFYSEVDKNLILDHVPEIRSFLIDKNLICSAVGLIKIFYNKVAIHQDNSSIAGNTIRINFPVLNCDKSRTIFYKNFNNTKETKLLLNGTAYHEYRDEDCEEIDHLCLDSVSALDVSVPHRVICEVFPRISLSLHLHTNPKWLLT